MTFYNNVAKTVPYLHNCLFLGKPSTLARMKERGLIATYSIACSVQNIRKRTVNIILVEGCKQ